MKKILGYIKLFFVVVVLMAITTSISGLRMNYHECDMSGKQSYILSFPLVSGEFSKEDFDCHCGTQTEKVQHCTSACQMSEPHKPVEADCCLSGEDLFVIDFEYLTGDVQKVKKPSVLSLLTSAERLIFKLEEDSSDKPYTPIVSPPGAENYGKQILIIYNQLKILSA